MVYHVTESVSSDIAKLPDGWYFEGGNKFYKTLKKGAIMSARLKRPTFSVIAETSGHPTYPVRPKSIDTREIFLGKFELEETARNLVRFCQSRDGWIPFTIDDLFKYSRSVNFDPNKMFFGMMGLWEDDGGFGEICESFPYLVAGADGRYYFTDVFVKRCSRKQADVVKKSA